MMRSRHIANILGRTDFAQHSKCAEVVHETPRNTDPGEAVVGSVQYLAYQPFNTHNRKQVKGEKERNFGD